MNKLMRDMFDNGLELSPEIFLSPQQLIAIIQKMLFKSFKPVMFCL